MDELNAYQSHELSRRLNDEIERLQGRIRQLGPDGDNGYERKMVRFFNEQLALRHERLARLTGQPPFTSAQS